MVTAFLAGFVRGANIQELSEAQAFLALPSFHTGLAKSHYEAGFEMVAPEEGGFSRMLEKVQYLVRNYAQSTHINSIISNLQAIRQKTT